MLLASAFGVLLWGLLAGVFPPGPGLMLVVLPLAACAVSIAWRYDNQRFHVRADALTIQIHLVSGLLLAAGLILNEFILLLFGA